MKLNVLDQYGKEFTVSRNLYEMIYDIGVLSGKQGEIIKYERKFNQDRLIITKVDKVHLNSTGGQQKIARGLIKDLYLRLMNWEEVK